MNKTEEQRKGIAWKIKLFLNRNKRYELIQRDGLNVLVETQESKDKSSKKWLAFNTFLSFVSAAAAIIAAIFAALAYVNP